MGIKHEVVKASGIRGYAAEWNADHIIDDDVDFDKNELLQAVVQNVTAWPAGPVEGQIIYRSDQHTFYHWNGTIWVALQGPATVVVAADGSGMTTSIQDGIDMLPAAGGVVYVKEGTYNISTAITIHSSNVTVFGAGSATVIFIINAADCNGIEIGDGNVVNSYSNIIVADLKIDGNETNQTIDKAAILIQQHSSNCKIGRCWVDDYRGWGIYIDDNSSGNVVQTCTVSNCTQPGIYAWGIEPGHMILDNTCDSNHTGIVAGKNSVVDSNLCSNNTNDGINVFWDKSTITSNRCVTNGRHGIFLQSNYCLVSSNLCNANTECGIKVLGVWASVLTSNQCYYNDQHGIHLQLAEHHAITGNVCNRNSRGIANTFDGIYLSNASTHNAIVGNICYDSFAAARRQRWGINEAAAADDRNEIIGNCCRFNVTGEINVSGPNTDSAHNQV